MSGHVRAPDRWGSDVVAPLAMVAAVVTGAVIPFLRFRSFYLSGDSIAQWLPVSRRIGDLLLAGESHLMDPEMWRGGNFVAEARFGVWNPFALLLDVTVLQLDDLAVAAMLANLAYLLILAIGTFVLAVEYGARPWPAALAGLVAATGGWTLWMDAAWWTPHLASAAFTPFVWVGARRVARGVGSPISLFVAGALCITIGNPYSNVVVGLIVVAVAVEFFDRDRLLPVVALGASLVALGLLALFVYVPFRQTSVVGFRESGVFNDESWSSGVGDLLTMSTPTASPYVRNFGRPVLGFPASYLAWFVLPLAPWLRWSSVRRREFVGLAVFGAVALLLMLGPSNIWFFRWPMRLTPYVYLPITIAVAVVLSRGAERDRMRDRSLVSGSLVVLGAYLAWADVPDDLRWHLAGAAVVGAATAMVLVAARRRPVSLAPSLMVATLAVLVLQVAWRPMNESVRHYGLPDSAAAYDARFGTRYDGTMLQVGAFDAIPAALRSPDGAYADLAVASAYSIGGVESISSYSGIGFSTHDAAVCLRFDGATCPEAWDRLFAVPESASSTLVDLLSVDTIVVQRTLIDTVDDGAPDGWVQFEVTPHAVVWKRSGEGSWPEARLSSVAGPVEVVAAIEERAHRETVEFARVGAGEAKLTFSRLAWPGYTATIDGRSLPVSGGPAGLLEVTIPADVDGGAVVLEWVPPFWRPLLAMAGSSVLLAVATEIVWRRRRRIEAAHDVESRRRTTSNRPVNRTRPHR